MELYVGMDMSLRLAMSHSGKRALHIDPPASSNAIMQRAKRVDNDARERMY